MEKQGGKNLIEKVSRNLQSNSNQVENISPHAGRKRKVEEITFFVCTCKFQAVAFIDLKKHVENNHLPPPSKIRRTTHPQMESVPEQQLIPTVQLGRINCELCEKTCANKRSLNAHMRTHDPGEKHYKCNNCDFASNWKSSLASHQKSSKNGKLNHCTFCAAKFCTANQLFQHIRDNHRNINVLAQAVEPAEVPTLFQHEQSERSGPLIFMDNPGRPVLHCIFCDFKTFDLVFLRRHSQEEHNQIQPDVLNAASQASLMEHQGEQHDGVIMDTAFLRSSASAQAIPSGLDSQQSEVELNETWMGHPNSSVICGTPVRSMNTTGTTPNGHRTLPKCHRCRWTFRSKFDLELHSKTCREKRFKCSHCNASFEIAANLGKHLIKIHHL